MTMRGLGKALTTAIAGSAALAAAAQAQSVTISPPKPCYLAGEDITATIAGFTPGGLVDIAIDGRSLGPLVADAAGGAAGTITLGGMRGAKSHGLTATDQTNPALVANAAFLGTTRQVVVKPRNAPAGRARRLKGYGFMAGPRVYMHVRGNGYSSDKRIAKPSGPCGTFVTRRVIVPASAGLGRYRVQFDAKKKYSKKTRPRFVGTMTVTPR
jgi:hypothetical protein